MLRFLPRTQLKQATTQAFYRASAKDIIIPPYDPAGPKMEAFHASPTKIRAIFGGNRSGKSEAGGYEMVRLCRTHPGITAWACTVSYDSISSYVWVKLKKYLHPGEIQAISWYNKTREIPAVIKLKNGSKIVCKSYDQGRERFQGASVFVVWLDEEPPETIFVECLARTIDCKGRIILTMTPLKGLSWTYDRIFMYEPPTDRVPDTIHWTVSLLENKHIGDDEKDEARRLYSVDELEQRIYGLFKQIEGAVWKEFDMDANLIDRFPIPRHWRRIRAIDFGYNHPFVCLWLAMDEEENVYVYQEYVKPSTLLQDHADNMKTLDLRGLADLDGRGDRGIENTVADHDKQDRAELDRYKIYTRPADKEVVLGIQIVNRMFKKREDHPERRPRLFLFKDLKYTIKEAREYHYPKNKITELPDKVNDDTQDSMRYGVMYFVSVMSRPPVVLESKPIAAVVAPSSLSLISPAQPTGYRPGNQSFISRK